uniref:Admp-1a n=2 Tax=Schmidtea mediterranea TaxID=79327 RepID=F1DT93_SCHMD|nr:admp-1a [Schmidtea mediterranea]
MIGIGPVQGKQLYLLKEKICQIKRTFQIAIGIALFCPSHYCWFWKTLKMYLLLSLFNNILIPVACASRIANFSDSSRNSYLTLNPFMDLARVLDIQPIYQHNSHSQHNDDLDISSTPDYFIKLYKSLSRSNGEGVGTPPYNADAIFGLMDNEKYSQRYYKFEIDETIDQSTIKSSEFHIYRLPRKSKARNKRDAGHLIIKLYLVTSPARKNTSYGNLYVGSQMVFISQYGWIILNLTDAMSKWVKEKIPNYGLYISIQNKDASLVSQSTVIFVQTSMRHMKRLQPIISIYTRQKSGIVNQNSEETDLSKAFENMDPRRYQKIYNGEFYVPPKRFKRSDPSETEDVVVERQKYCFLYPMKVDFDKMGWNQWIIGPQSFSAGICIGSCPYPLGQTYHPTNHAVVQSIWYNLNPNNDIIGPVCCSPHEFKTLRMLYYNNERVVALKSYDNMIIKSCGCK